MTLIERFLAKVTKGKKDECWLWQVKSRDKDGYGQFKLNGKVERSHRVAYSLFVGPLSPKLVVLHSCDNPPCCNPSHLTVGTHLDNMQDKSRKDRCRGTEKITRQQASEIREARMRGVPLERLARKYKVSLSTISMCDKGSNWKVNLDAIEIEGMNK